MKGQYGSSVRFRLLKWLNPLLMTAIFAVCWCVFYASDHAADVSVTANIVFVAAYMLLMMWLEKTYHALTVGLLRVTELVYSQTLSFLICNAIGYAVACLYLHELLSIWMFLVMTVVQFAVSVIWSFTANSIYYRIYPAPETVVVYRSDADFARIRGIRYFDEHFNVTKVIADPQMSGEELINELKGFRVIFVSGIESTLRNDIAKYCVTNDVCGYFVPRLGDLVMAGANYMSMFSEPIMKVSRATAKREYAMVKRAMDIVISFIGLVVAGPIMAVTAIAIKVNDGGPVFYRQKRLTRNGRVFSILKFRSMNVNAEKDGVARLASENDTRITPIGKFIRATRIDELPQLINILAGDMSIVGPRPERPEIAFEYLKGLPEFDLRLQVKAGLTGMAQVYGRYNTEPYSKLQMDLMYINQMSFATDIKLIFSTIKIIFLKESTAGIQTGNVTAASENRAQTEKKSA